MSLRDGPLGDIKVPLTWTAALALVVAVVAALALLLGDRRETMRSEAYDATRKTVDQVAAPVGGVLSAPIHWMGSGADYVKSYFFAASENRRLKLELVKAGKWRDEAEALSEENARYRAMMGVKTDPPIAMVFARTVSDSRGPFANTRLADVGADRGVIEGNPVLGEHGLVGRIVGVSPSASRILLLTDTESRTPVLAPRTNARAILTGDGSGSPKLNYLRTHDPLREGDRVLTSGDGGVFPRGLPVGTVVKDADGAWRVALDADSSPMDFVQILLFRDFSQLIQPKSLEPKELPSAMTEEAGASILGSTAAASKSSAAKSPGTPAAAAAKPATVKPVGPTPPPTAAGVTAKPTPNAAAKAAVKPPAGGAAAKAVAKPDAAKAAAKPLVKPAVTPSGKPEAKPLATAATTPAAAKAAHPAKPVKPAKTIPGGPTVIVAPKPAAPAPPAAEDEGPPI